MRYEFTGSDLTFCISLDPPADSATVKWSLRDNTGTLVEGFTNQAEENEDQATTVTVTIPQSQNDKELITETRFIVLTWLANEVSQTTTFIYVLTNYMPLRIQAPDVRTVFSLDESELDDSEIDLVYAATVVSQDIGSTAFNTALIAGDITTQLVNAMVAYRAAINLVPSLAMRIAQSISADTTRFTRLRTLTTDQIVTALREEYDRLRTALLNPQYKPPTLVAGSVPALDPVRGPLMLWPFVGFRCPVFVR